MMPSIPTKRIPRSLLFGDLRSVQWCYITIVTQRKISFKCASFWTNRWEYAKYRYQYFLILARSQGHEYHFVAVTLSACHFISYEVKCVFSLITFDAEDRTMATIPMRFSREYTSTVIKHILLGPPRDPDPRSSFQLNFSRSLRKGFEASRWLKHDGSWCTPSFLCSDVISENPFRRRR